LHEVAEPAVTKPELAFQVALDEALHLIEQAVARIKNGEGSEAALGELWAALSGVQTKVARDPGINTAADDLYDAASTVVATERAGTVVGVRPWRLLNEADARLRARLGSARPSSKAMVLGPH